HGGGLAQSNTATQPGPLNPSESYKSNALSVTPLRVPCGATRSRRGNPAHAPGIEGVEMRNVYYNRMRNLLLAIPCLLVSTLAAVPLSPQSTPVKAASLESHEGLTISALPWMNSSNYKEKFPKKSPYSAGILAIQVSFRND